MDEREAILSQQRIEAVWFPWDDLPIGQIVELSDDARHNYAGDERYKYSEGRVVGRASFGMIKPHSCPDCKCPLVRNPFDGMWEVEMDDGSVVLWHPHSLVPVKDSE